MPDARPIAEWPLLLCGPMLRHVSARSVSVFLATREPCTVQLTLYVGDIASAGARVGNATSATIALGRGLHVCVITVGGALNLSAGIIYGYDVTLTPTSGGTSQSLQQLGLLGGPYPLGYADGRLPTFSLPPSRQYLRLAYASCRKPHGGERDALPILDAEIEKIVRSGQTDNQRALNRPHQLFLVGDQIYADDVSICLLKTLMGTAANLLGWDEGLDFRNPYTSGAVLQNSPEIQPGKARHLFLSREEEITSDHLVGHLLFIGEFYAMYLAVWSDTLWPRDEEGNLWLPTPEELVLKSDRKAEWYDKAEDDRDNALRFAKDLPLIRRAFANVPTWMIFDDHEVTDDWNLHGKWSRDVRGSKVGRRLLRNGLLSYAVFQDWGNRPDVYSSGLGADLLDSLVASGTRPPIADTPDMCDTLLDIGEIFELPAELTESGIEAALVNRMAWNYVVAGPEHQVIVLDIRTWRNFPGGAENAGLITDASLAKQLDVHRPPEGSSMLSFIVSGAPVIGHPILEDGVQKFMVDSKPSGPQTYDNEPWGGNRRAFEYLLDRLAQFRRVVILSGDVHYAFSNYLAYFPRSDFSLPPARIVQLCASSLKNEDFKTKLLGSQGYVGLTELGWFGYNAVLDSLKSELRTNVLRYLNLRELPTLVKVLYWDFVVSNRLAAPAVIPSGPWFDQEAFDLVSGDLGPADWLYSVFYASDERTVDDRLRDSPEVAAELNWRPGWEKSFVCDRSRTVVGTNNLADVTFDVRNPAAEKVVHRIYWWTPTAIFDPTLDSKVMFTKHVLPLSIPTTSERPNAWKWSGS